MVMSNFTVRHMFVTTTKQQHVITNRHHHLRTGRESKVQRVSSIVSLVSFKKSFWYPIFCLGRWNTDRIISILWLLHRNLYLTGTQQSIVYPPETCHPGPMSWSMHVQSHIIKALTADKIDYSPVPQLLLVGDAGKWTRKLNIQRQHWHELSCRRWKVVSLAAFLWRRPGSTSGPW